MGVVVWTMRSPYVFVGGKLEAEGPGAKFALSWDGSPGTMSAPTSTRFFHRTGRRGTPIT